MVWCGLAGAINRQLSLNRLSKSGVYGLVDQNLSISEFEIADNDL